MKEDRIKELFSNEEFVKDLFESESYEEAQKKLADKDVEVSVDELKKACDILKKKQSGELSDDELESIAGGLEAITGLSLWMIGVIVGGFTYGTIKAKC